MDFRSPTASAQARRKTIKRFTEHLPNKDVEIGVAALEKLFEELGDPVEGFPDWHPIRTAPGRNHNGRVKFFDEIDTYSGKDHTILFVKGFVTCPFNEATSDALVEAADQFNGLSAERLYEPLWSEGTFPVKVTAIEIELEGDGTIPLRQVMRWHFEGLAKSGRFSDVAETWWNMRSELMGRPHGSRSSLFVNQNTGGHIRKTLEAANDSGMFGPVREWSLDMLSERKQDQIRNTMFEAAIKASGGKSGTFKFQLVGQSCQAKIRDVDGDGSFITVAVSMNRVDRPDGSFQTDLMVDGVYKPENHEYPSSGTPLGKLAFAKMVLGD
ncbi:hypothetical protein [Parasedimentitalea psychrophila]|uniref:Uncharacterized protein n=1 Tax=Parasedimentitalea psychrophila TaxID=2997337 RepID=A0A9Y2KZ40_9RHOB|nr:hypothetical protein [Parasedimentitalea psychrophila]WIY24537.1 hypothetical protein QPJ95_18655 [Parasedimentitalea psychrophila]